MALHNETGQKGELIAKNYLEEKEYEILEKNWTFRRAEIDLIVRKGKTIIFVEVKTRSSVSYGFPEDFVNEAKQKNLRRAAEAYIYYKQIHGEIRFDIVSILFDKSGSYSLRHIEDAFW